MGFGMVNIFTILDTIKILGAQSEGCRRRCKTIRTVDRTFSVLLASFVLFASLAAPIRVVAQSNAALSAPQNSIDTRITTLREMIEKNDSQVLLPSGWHALTLPVGSVGRAAAPNGPVD